jgi:hypothetical protein
MAACHVGPDRKQSVNESAAECGWELILSLGIMDKCHALSTEQNSVM